MASKYLVRVRVRVRVRVGARVRVGVRVGVRVRVRVRGSTWRPRTAGSPRAQREIYPSESTSCAWRAPPSRSLAGACGGRRLVKVGVRVRVRCVG